MRSRSVRGVVVALVLAVAWPSPSRAGTTAPLEAACSVRFTGRSTLHDFEGTAPVVHAAVRPAATAGRWDAVVEIPVGGLDTGNAARDARMRGLLDDERWPAIRGHVRDLDADLVASSRRLPFALTIRDVTREVTATLSHWERSAERVAFDADFAVSLDAFGLEPPSVLGLVRVDDRVRVHAHVVVTAPHPPA